MIHIRSISDIHQQTHAQVSCLSIERRVQRLFRIEKRSGRNRSRREASTRGGAWRMPAAGLRTMGPMSEAQSCRGMRMEIPCDVERLGMFGISIRISIGILQIPFTSMG